ncbi:hypothetical protein EDEG_02977 [Edhazardia aedis USNM 41457]|uniref:Uncharacterized protein n=1 Tax=Edhazardia aedis (strain USNM 41457) TaxID=1003232 RepID=J9D515_EDHAE|nr:hypothetical protein EDEG_02977 [Edhazardia aedis USNM 41457]|eukprot:EJW02619.1 hypothetical protein EDEG_02977 [Edhazardia aedis USNM 41457]
MKANFFPIVLLVASTFELNVTGNKENVASKKSSSFPKYLHIRHCANPGLFKSSHVSNEENEELSNFSDLENEDFSVSNDSNEVLSAISKNMSALSNRMRSEISQSPAAIRASQAVSRKNSLQSLKSAESLKSNMSKKGIPMELSSQSSMKSLLKTPSSSVRSSLNTPKLSINASVKSIRPSLSSEKKSSAKLTDSQSFQRSQRSLSSIKSLSSRKSSSKSSSRKPVIVVQPLSSERSLSESFVSDVPSSQKFESSKKSNFNSEQSNPVVSAYAKLIIQGGEEVDENKLKGLLRQMLANLGVIAGGVLEYFDLNAPVDSSAF